MEYLNRIPSNEWVNIITHFMNDDLDYGSYYPLVIFACYGNNYYAIKALFKHEFDINITSVDGMTPLLMASKLLNYDSIKALIECGATGINTALCEVSGKWGLKFYKKCFILLIVAGARLDKTPMLILNIEAYTLERKTLLSLQKCRLATIAFLRVKRTKQGAERWDQFLLKHIAKYVWKTRMLWISKKNARVEN